MEDVEAWGGHPRCPSCGVVMRDRPKGYQCPECGIADDHSKEWAAGGHQPGIGTPSVQGA